MVYFIYVNNTQIYRYDFSNVDDIPPGNTAAEEQIIKKLYQSQLGSSITHRRRMTGSICKLIKHNLWVHESKEDKE